MQLQLILILGGWHKQNTLDTWSNFSRKSVIYITNSETSTPNDPSTKILRIRRNHSKDCSCRLLTSIGTQVFHRRLDSLKNLIRVWEENNDCRVLNNDDESDTHGRHTPTESTSMSIGRNWLYPWSKKIPMIVRTIHRKSHILQTNQRHSQNVST